MIQKNVDGTGLNRTWEEYITGFGDYNSDYWIGNKVLSLVTANISYSLNIVLESLNMNSRIYHAKYKTFKVLPEAEYYKLQVDGYSGDANEDMLKKHDNAKFSTYDQDNDGAKRTHCAEYFGGGWWYSRCGFTYLNVKQDSSGFFKWRNLPGGDTLKSSEMWLEC